MEDLENIRPINIHIENLISAEAIENLISSNSFQKFADVFSIQSQSHSNAEYNFPKAATLSQVSQIKKPRKKSAKRKRKFGLPHYEVFTYRYTPVERKTTIYNLRGSCSDEIKEELMAEDQELEKIV